MVAKKLRLHCATCGTQFDQPQGWAYCSKACERGRRGADRDIEDSHWLRRIYVRRLALGVRLESAPPCDRQRLLAEIAQTHEAEALVREHLAEANAPRDSVLFWAPLVDREADRFESAMRKSVAAAIRLGKRLLEAKAALAHGEFGRLFADHPQAVEGALRISPRWAQRLMSIAANRAITNATHASHLPADLTSVYTLSRLPEQELEAAIADGSVRPDMRREDVRRLLPADDSEHHEPDHEVVKALAPVSEQLRRFLEQRPESLREVRAHLRDLLRQIDAGGRNG